MIVLNSVPIQTFVKSPARYINYKFELQLLSSAYLNAI